MTVRRAPAIPRALRAVAAFALAAAALLASSPARPADAPASRVPKPAITTPAGEKCVEDAATMRRMHMTFIRHQRDRTVHEGIRTTRHSLANCVDCHASRSSGRVTGSKDAFCESCHRYAGVTLDCFECHADRAAAKPVAGAAGAPR